MNRLKRIKNGAQGLVTKKQPNAHPMAETDFAVNVSAF